MTRASIYVRVSSEEQVDNFSLEAQLKACRAYCLSRSWGVVREYVEEGRSAKGRDTRKRPLFRALLDSADRREIDVIVVHKLDRWARNQSVLWDSLERLAKASVALASVSEDVDYTTPAGRMFLGMVGNVAAYFSDNLSSETKKGKTERRAQGLYNGVLPFGYVRKSERAEAVIGEHAAIGVRLAFDLAVQGKTAREIAEALKYGRLPHDWQPGKKSLESGYRAAFPSQSLLPWRAAGRNRGKARGDHHA